MVSFKKLWLIFVLFTLVTNSSFSQEIDTKYLLSIIYLQNDKVLNDKVKSTFKKEIKRKKSVHFEIADKISFIDTRAFEKELKKENINLTKDLKNTKFEAFDNSFKDLLSNDENGIKIHFSKPIDNILILELSSKDLNSLPIKLGKSILVLFIFNEKGFIEKTYTKSIINN